MGESIYVRRGKTQGQLDKYGILAFYKLNMRLVTIGLK